jgi:glycerophosphoryl diester phosphodiesterase
VAIARFVVAPLTAALTALLTAAPTATLTAATATARATTATATANCPRPPPVRIADLPHRFFVAHRGAGAYVAPENTEEALRLGAADPDADLLEFDVRVLADGTGAIWHDATVDRLTTSTGPVGRLTRTEFERLRVDASSWFGGGVKDTHPIVLDRVLDEFGGRHLLLAHPKDTAATRLVIREVSRRGLRDSVLVQTFSREDVRRVLAAGLHGQLLISDPARERPERIVADGIRRVSLDNRLPDDAIRAYVRAGLSVSVWNVDRQYRRDHLYRLGVRGIDSDDPTYVSGDTARYRRAHDPFARQTWWYGHIGQNQSPTRLTATARGRFERPDRWHVDRGEYPLFVLQGWTSPLPSPRSYELRTTLRYDDLGADRTRWAGVYFSAKNDSAYSGADSPRGAGYSAVLRVDGTLGLYREDPGRTVALKTVTTPPPRRNQAIHLRIAVEGGTVSVTRGHATISVHDDTYRGRYVFLGRQASPGHEGPGVSFSGVRRRDGLRTGPVEPATASRHRGGPRAGSSASPSSASRR